MSTPIDPASISSWEDAFQHPIPQVRQLERQLRADLATNKEKLRGLVGESYRDLLQTAERIIDMDVAAQSVEAALGDASRNCNSRLLERKVRNLRVFNETTDKRDKEKYSFAAQLAVLQACPSVISRLLHKDQGEACLLAAKVFVISRLLLKSLSEESSLPLLSTLRSQLSTLRPILLQHIDNLISSSMLETPLLVSALTAFSVLKTSSPPEVLRHFLYIRSTALSSLLNTADPDIIMSSVALFNKTLGDAATSFPGQLSNALVTMKSKSLLEDVEVSAIPELVLDVNSRWLPDDIRGFIPWVRHDDLESTRAKELVRAWAEKEVVKLNEKLERSVEVMPDIASIVKLRGGFLALWRFGAQIRRKFLLDGNNGGENFRSIIVARMVDVMKTVAEELKDVAEKIQSLLDEAEAEPEDSTSLWPSKPLTIDLSNGAAAFRAIITNRVHGRSPVVLSFLSVYHPWLTKVSLIATILRDLRSSNDPQAPDQEDEDFEAEEERTQAGMEDSLQAERELSGALDNAYHLLERGLMELLEPTPTVTRRQATFLLRCARQLRKLPPKRQSDDAPILSLGWFGVEFIPRLHQIVATDVMGRPLETAASQLRLRRWEEPLVSKQLWEGEGSGQMVLPTQPSPAVFGFLHELVAAMSKAGEDVWTPAAVKAVKAEACNGIWGAFEEVLQGREVGEVGEVVNGVVKEVKEVVEKTEEVAPVEDETRNGEAAEAEAANPEPTVDQKENIPAESEPSAPEPEVEIQEAEPQEAAASPTSKSIITRDWTLQLLFDSLYLDEALHRKRRRGSGSPVISLVGKVDSFIGTKLDLDEELRMRLEGSASEYWKRTCLLFALLR